MVVYFIYYFLNKIAVMSASVKKVEWQRQSNSVKTSASKKTKGSVKRKTAFWSIITFLTWNWFKG
jgi:hypothetical protein